VKFFIASGCGLAIAGSSALYESIPVGIGLLIAAFFLILTGYKVDLK